MTTTAAPTTYTPAEIARLSDQTGKHYELIDGNLVEKPMSTRANWIATQIGFLLKSAYPQSRAYVFVEQPTYCFADPRQMRKPDVALVWADRLPGGLGDDELLIAPDLVVEVASPSNTYTGQEDRVEEYLAAGVPLVWLVNPVRRSALVCRADGSVARLRSSDTLTDEPLLPGLTLQILDFFPAASQATTGS